jgi:ring-1,2-phenylacetyl-CoA epoxidase subunit PaaB
LESLDPRVNRLPEINVGVITSKVPLDQLGNFEVFVQAKDGKPFQHEGTVHADDLEMAFVLAKETFTRRFLCTSLWVVDTQNVFVSPLTDAGVNAYTAITAPVDSQKAKVSFEIFHLYKRGKQHLHATTIVASTPDEAMWASKKIQSTTVQIFNIWAIPTREIRKTRPEEKDLWLTLPDKKFRDAAAYKGGDRLKEFLERTNNKL